MVIARRSRTGGSLLGCLFWLAVFGVAAYYGVHVGAMYWRQYQLRDEMRIGARHAPRISDNEIRQRIEIKGQELFGPEHGLRIRVDRTSRPGRILIDVQYRDSVALPFFHRRFDFRPRVEAPI